MAKRLTGTNKWDKAWFRKLSPRHKALWQFLCDKCDQAGMWEIDIESASHFINDVNPITEDDFKVFGDRLERYNLEKLWIVDFVDFQCGALSHKSPAHKPVFKLLIKYNLLNRVLYRLSNSLQEKEKEIEGEKKGEKEEGGAGETEPEQKGPKPMTDDRIEPLTDEWFKYIFDENYLVEKIMTYREIDVQDQYIKFKSKVRGSPTDYIYRDTDGMRKAFDYHLRTTKPQKKYASNSRTLTETSPTPGKDYSEKF